MHLPVLRAGVPVLRTPPGLDRDAPLDLHLGAAPAHPDLVRQLEQRRDVLLGEVQHLDELWLAETAAAVENLAARLVQDVAGVTHVRQSIVRPVGVARAVRSSAVSVRLLPREQPRAWHSSTTAVA